MEKYCGTYEQPNSISEPTGRKFEFMAPDEITDDQLTALAIAAVLQHSSQEERDAGEEPEDNDPSQWEPTTRRAADWLLIVATPYRGEELAILVHAPE